MKIKSIFAIFFALLITFNLKAQDTTNVKDSTSAKKEYRKINQVAFKTGEKFTFQINYGFATAGSGAIIS